ncbi:uncharacterized protein FIBRA_09331 [Fibroporia radiculosa]|uniref:Uncharacterized protein n=1 Tax=Fibroporia radiculosa TaxID=599839 RepID=J7RHE8_9APHY|nr:uncharacterized protein FIBRA_09331 [Fibroporia radiculosa]CCM07012.1 predicted protein [Fibroporia radiculosa]
MPARAVLRAWCRRQEGDLDLGMRAASEEY